MKFRDMTLGEFADYCYTTNCRNCPFNRLLCKEDGMLPYELEETLLLDMEVTHPVYH